jgi:hypothetical protein
MSVTHITLWGARTLSKINNNNHLQFLTGVFSWIILLESDIIPYT